MRKTLNQLISKTAGFGLLGALCATMPAWASGTTPLRAPGLWEMQAQGMPRAGRMCVGTNDDMTRQRPPDGVRAECDAPVWKQLAADKWTLDQVCRSPGVTATHHSEISGDFASRLTMRTQARYQPARPGRAEEAHEMTFVRVGDCPSGVAPGSMVLPNGMVIDPSKAIGGMTPPRP
ncbi:DUF3617 family protein [Ideonella sp. DXS29W]|uniref:DUF3617 family protein n=1 Tax=Ideonella lacteola TaxID=2984193 RepID=A0ABU9BYI4_9BURK